MLQPTFVVSYFPKIRVENKRDGSIDNNPNILMAVVTMFMPTMGESVMEATILQWLKQEGEMITEEESILEVATDKIDSEVPTPYAGRLQQVLAKKGEVVKIGAPLAIIAIEGEAIAAISPFLLQP